MKIAIVRNNEQSEVIARFGQPCPESYAQKHIDLVQQALFTSGYEVAIIQADKHLLQALEDFMPADPLTGVPTGLVFNMAYGIQGENRYTHLPGMLEMAGIPYTGSTPMGHSLALDKVITKILMQHAGIPTPAFKTMDGSSWDDSGLRYPLIVKPVHESTSYGLEIVHNREELERGVTAIVNLYQQPALVEEYIDGREVAIGLLGNGDEIEALPTVELDFSGRGLKLMTWDDKYHKRQDEPTKVCPAPLDEAFNQQLQAISKAVFNACHLRDYARVDIRIDPNGNPFVLEINSMASLGDGGSYVKSATTAGYSMQTLIARIVDVALTRYYGKGAADQHSARQEALCITP